MSSSIDDFTMSPEQIGSFLNLVHTEPSSLSLPDVKDYIDRTLIELDQKNTARITQVYENINSLRPVVRDNNVKITKLINMLKSVNNHVEDWLK